MPKPLQTQTLITYNHLPLHKDETNIKILIIRYADLYNVNINTALQIANCESKLNPLAKNKISTAKGIYQFTDPTWKWIKAKGNQYNYQENIKEFMIYYKKYPSWWSQCLPD